MGLKTPLRLKGILIAVAGASTLLTAGCASAPAEVRVQGVAVPGWWIDRAEKGVDDGNKTADRSQAQACLSLSKKLWERDVIESLRYLRKGAELRDAECCRQYLARSESAGVNLSQRLYARLFIEGLLRRGRVLSPRGEDITGDLYYQLCWAWRYTEPRCPSKAKQVLGALLETGLGSEQAKSTFIREMILETGLQADSVAKSGARRQEIQMYAGESADEAKSWLQVPLSAGRHETGDWAVTDVNVWGGGSDRLFLGTNVLAFLVNDQGEPSFRGRTLWICNLGTSPVYISSLATSQSNHEVSPGHEESLLLDPASLETSETTTGIPLTVRYRRSLR